MISTLKTPDATATEAIEDWIVYDGGQRFSRDNTEPTDRNRHNHTIVNIILFMTRIMQDLTSLN